MQHWKDTYLGYSTTGDTEAVNRVIELHQHTARGYRSPADSPRPDL